MNMLFSGGFRSLSLMGIFFLVFGIRVACANDLHLASIYVDAGRLADAVNILKKYEASDEDESKVNRLTGKIYLAIDKPAKALEFFEMADVKMPMAAYAADNSTKPKYDPTTAAESMFPLGLPRT
jgi:tetratricopeptide (TPR) repeat protein